jgi:transposase
MPAIKLPNFTVLGIKEALNDIAVGVEYTGHPSACERCKSTTATLKRHDSREQWILDFPIRGKRTKLCLEHRRFKCSECGKVFFEPLIGIDEKRNMTARLVAWIGPEALAVPFHMMAHNLGCTDSTVRNVFMEYAEQKAKELKSKTPRVLGIDEICLGKIKRDKYRCVITDIEDHSLVEFLRDRDKKTVIKYFTTLDASAVKIVCCDMWLPYRDAARIVFPGAVVVIDRFHIVRMVQNSMEAFRKAIRKPTTGKERAMLKNDRFVLLSRNIDLDPFQQATLASWFKRWPDIEDVYNAKERFLDIWLCPTREEAEYWYGKWEESIPGKVRSYFTDIFTAVGNWHHEIFNWWDYKFTNAFTEGLNSGIRHVYDGGCGISFEVLRFKLLYTKGTHKLYTKKPKFERQGFDTNSWSRMIYQPEQPEVINCGVDISTLLAFIKDGKL